jgi:magnesium chelatase subunit I
VREELRANLIEKLRSGEDLFPGIVGYDQTVVPQLQNAILSGQDIILLGERGQAKSRIIRSLTSLFDEWTPILAGPEIPENPFEPITPMGVEMVAEQGDDAQRRTSPSLT